MSTAADIEARMLLHVQYALARICLDECVDISVLFDQVSDHLVTSMQAKIPTELALLGRVKELQAALDAATAERDAARRNCDDARLEVKQLQCVVSNAFREREAAQQRIAELEAALELMVNAYPNMTDEVWREGDRVLREVQP